MFDAFSGDQLVGEFFDFGALAADGEDFETVVVVEVAVERGDDDVAVFVLEVGEEVLEVVPVVVVHEGDAAGNVGVGLLLPMFDEVGADHVGDGQRAVVVAFFGGHGVEFAGEGGRQGNAEACGGVFHGVTIHQPDNTAGGGWSSGMIFAGLRANESIDSRATIWPTGVCVVGCYGWGGGG